MRTVKHTFTELNDFYDYVSLIVTRREVKKKTRSFEMILICWPLSLVFFSKTTYNNILKNSSFKRKRITFCVPNYICFFAEFVDGLTKLIVCHYKRCTQNLMSRELNWLQCAH